LPGRLARRRRAPGRLARLAVAASLLGVALAAAPGDAATEVCPGGVQQFPDGWDQISLPSGFVTTEHPLENYALDVGTTDHLIATNGVQITHSTDGGCRWHDSALPAETSVPTILAGEDVRVLRRTITQVAISPYGGPAWALGVTDVEINNTPLTQPVVFASRDGGATFSAAAKGLPPTGQPLRLAPIPGTAAAYLLLRQLGPQHSEDTYSMYRTTDGGANWAQVSTALPAFNGIAVGGGRGGLQLWAWDDSALYRSANGAAFTAVSGVKGAVRTVDLSAGAVTVFFTTGARRLVSADGGSSWRSLPAPENVKSATHGPMPGLLAVSGDYPNVEVDPPASSHRKPFIASPLETNVSDLQMSMSFESYGFVLYGASSNDIFRFRVPASFLYAPPPPPLAPAVNPVHVQARAPSLRAPELSPAIATVTLQPRQRRDVPYRLLLPPTPTPLDVYFMTDSTGSMSDTIGSVQDSIQQIVDDLAATGANVHFGVADFRDFPMENGLVASDDWAYRRDRAVGPVDDAFGQALQAIRTGGGSTDGGDSGLEAIYQAATGAGRRVVSDPTGGSDIPPGQGAGFRPNAVKVIVVAADAAMRHPEDNPGWPGASLATDAATLSQLGIHLVGLDVDTNSGQDPGPDMKTLAAATHTVAGPAGVDCDGDGTADVRAGDPLVCPYSPSAHASIAPAFLGLLDSLRDVKPVSLGVVGPRDVVRPLGATTFPRVNVKAQNALGVPLEFRCDPPRFGRTTTVRVVASVAARQVASLPVAVKCLAPAPLPVAAPLLALPAVAAVAIAPPVPPAQPNPNPNPPQPNPQPQTQPNPGAASQEDEVQQLAFAQEGLVPDEPGLEALQMSGLRSSAASSGLSSPGGDRAATYLLAAGVMLAAGAACRLRSSHRLSWGRNP
jgi:hypothetical protein